MEKAFKLTLFILFIGLSINPALGQGKKIIGFRKTACLGPCPVFSINVLDNCKVILQADQFVEIGQGEFKSKLTRTQFDDLIQEFRQSGFFKLEESYQSNKSDLPTTFFYFADNGSSKTIEVYGDWPDSLVKLDQKIGVLIKTLEWRKVRGSKK